MTRFGRLCAISAMFLVIALSFANPAGAIVISPSTNAAVEGNSNNAFPFNIGAFGISAQRYQQVYAASEFGSSMLSITGIAFRPDAETGGAFSTTLPSVTIMFSTTAAAVGGLSLTFGTNEGADLTTVFSGSLLLSSAFTGPAGGPKDFDIVINLTTPFLYDPTLGNLLLEVQNFGGGSTTQFDAVTSSSLVSRVFNADNTASGASAVGGDPSGLVTKFFESPVNVPEPSTLALFGAGLLGLAALRRRRKAKA